MSQDLMKMMESQIQELRAKLEASEQECASWRTVLNHEREAAQQQLAASEERVKEFECDVQLEGCQFRQFAQDVMKPGTPLATDGPISFGKLVEVVEATITAQQEEIGRLKGTEAPSSTGHHLPCSHSSYWTTVFGNCMACRAERAEKRLDQLKQQLTAQQEEIRQLHTQIRELSGFY